MNVKSLYGENFTSRKIKLPKSISYKRLQNAYFSEVIFINREKMSNKGEHGCILAGYQIAYIPWMLSGLCKMKGSLLRRTFETTAVKHTTRYVIFFHITGFQR